MRAGIDATATEEESEALRQVATDSTRSIIGKEQAAKQVQRDI